MPPGDSTQHATSFAAQAQGIIGQLMALGAMINTIGFANVLLSGAMIWLFAFMMGWAPNPLVSATQFKNHELVQADQTKAAQEMVKQLREIKCDGKVALKEIKDCYRNEALDWK